MGTHSASRKEMRFRQVKQCLESGISITQWCKLNKVPESTLYGWLKIYREEENAVCGKEKSHSGWIEVKRQDLKDTKALAIRDVSDASATTNTEPVANTTANNMIQVSLNGALIMIPPNCDSATIKSVLSAVACL